MNTESMSSEGSSIDNGIMMGWGGLLDGARGLAFGSVGGLESVGIGQAFY